MLCRCGVWHAAGQREGAMSLRATSELSVLTDEQLCEQVRQGDREAFATLWQRHYAEASGYARKLDPRAAEDAVAEVLARVFADLTQGKGPNSAFRSYLLLSIRNSIYRGARGIQTSELPAENLLPAHEAHIEMEQDEETRVVHAALQDLPERWREALLLSEVEGRSLAEIGERFNIAPNAVSALLRRARGGLRRAWVSAHFSGAKLSEECASVIEAFGDFRWGTPTPQQRTWFEAHVRACDTCAEQRGAHAWIAQAVGLALLPLAWVAGSRPHPTASAAQATLRRTRQVALGTGASVVAVGIAAVAVLTLAADGERQAEPRQRPVSITAEAIIRESLPAREPSAVTDTRQVPDAQPAPESQPLASDTAPPPSNPAPSVTPPADAPPPAAKPIPAPGWTEVVAGGTTPGTLVSVALSDGRTLQTVADDSGNFTLTVDWNDTKPTFQYTVSAALP